MYFMILLFSLINFSLYFFFFNDTATPEIYTLSLHDALPIFRQRPTATFLPSQRICERCYCSGRQQNQAVLRRHRLKERQYAQSYTRFLVCGVVCLGSAGRHNLHADSAPRPTESYAHEASNSSTTKPRRTTDHCYRECCVPTRCRSQFARFSNIRPADRSARNLSIHPQGRPLGS